MLARDWCPQLCPPQGIPSCMSVEQGTFTSPRPGPGPLAGSYERQTRTGTAGALRPMSSVESWPPPGSMLLLRLPSGPGVSFAGTRTSRSWLCLCALVAWAVQQAGFSDHILLHRMLRHLNGPSLSPPGLSSTLPPSMAGCVLPLRHGPEGLPVRRQADCEAATEQGPQMATCLLSSHFHFCEQKSAVRSDPQELPCRAELEVA